MTRGARINLVWIDPKIGIRADGGDRIANQFGSSSASFWATASGRSATGPSVWMMPVIPGNPWSVHSGPIARASAAASGCDKTGRTIVSAQA